MKFILQSYMFHGFQETFQSDSMKVLGLQLYNYQSILMICQVEVCIYIPSFSMRFCCTWRAGW